MPSVGEGLAGVIMEAMTFKLPVVSTNIAGVNDLIINNKTGYLGPIDGINYFVDKIKVLINDKKKRTELGINGYEHIKKYSWEKVVEKHLDIYK